MVSIGSIHFFNNLRVGPPVLLNPTVRSAVLVKSLFCHSLLTHDVSTAAHIHYTPTPTNSVPVTNVFIRSRATVLQPVWEGKQVGGPYMTNHSAASLLFLYM